MSNIKSTPNYTGLAYNDRFYVGYLGELVFQQYCNSMGWKYDYSVRTDGESDTEDFVIYIDGIGYTVDVKTASKPYYKNIMIPQSQMNRYEYDYYAGVRLLHNDLAEVHGFCTKDEMILNTDGFTAAGVPTFYKPLRELKCLDY